jgi:DNA gyrase/topoisomerase IV subunit A
MACRGSRARAWQIIVTEIPYQVQKSKLIERLAEVIQTKKVPAAGRCARRIRR